jgi:drug/metabolite transporter (DMT)-like permease
MTPSNRALLQIHGCVAIWGFTAILGKLITLPAYALVWWRMLLVVAALCLAPAFWRGLRRLDWLTLGVFAGIGVVVALHWVSFYAAIKLANASVAATCMAVAPILVSIIEPWVTGRRFDWRELLIGIAAVPGVMLVVGGTPRGMHAGIAVGILSALLVAVFAVLNKRHVERADPLVVTGLELAAGTTFLTVLAVVLGRQHTGLPVVPEARDAALLLVLALACTLLPFALSLVALRKLSAFSTQLAISLEPVYAVFLAMLLLGEHRELGLQFYAGLALILGSVLAHVALRRSPG